MESPIIASGSWTGLDEPKLDTFSTTASMVLSDEDVYGAVKFEYDALDLASIDYHKKYSRFIQFGGTDNKDAKDGAKATLYNAHAAMAKKLEETYTGVSSYLTRPGYRTDEKGGAPSTADIVAPLLQKKSSKDVRGWVKFILKAAKSTEIKAIEARCSIDGGTTYIQMGIVAVTLNFILENQPSGKYVTYQFRFIATSGRKSPWSEKFSLDVF